MLGFCGSSSRLTLTSNESVYMLYNGRTGCVTDIMGADVIHSLYWITHKPQGLNEGISSSLTVLFHLFSTADGAKTNWFSLREEKAEDPAGTETETERERWVREAGRRRRWQGLLIQEGSTGNVPSGKQVAM